MSTFRPRIVTGPGIFLVLTWALTLAGGGCAVGETRDHHAALVEEYWPTPFADDDAPFFDPDRALGPPDGKTVALGRGGSITLRFFRSVPIGPGPELRIYEIGDDGARAKVAVSEDGADFRELQPFATGPVSDFELEPLVSSGIHFVRVRGVDDQGMDPGFDLDAVEALR